MKRDRLAHGWSLREMHARTEVHIGTLSQVENGKRPMTEALAAGVPASETLRRVVRISWA